MQLHIDRVANVIEGKSTQKSALTIELKSLNWVLSICPPHLHALSSVFTITLPNLTGGLLIRHSVSQAVLSLCRNIHLLSVYFHLRKSLPTVARFVLPGLWFRFDQRLSESWFYIFACSNFNLIIIPLGHDISFQVTDGLRNVSHTMA